MSAYDYYYYAFIIFGCVSSISLGREKSLFTPTIAFVVFVYVCLILLHYYSIW